MCVQEPSPEHKTSVSEGYYMASEEPLHSRIGNDFSAHAREQSCDMSACFRAYKIYAARDAFLSALSNNLLSLFDEMRLDSEFEMDSVSDDIILTWDVVFRFHTLISF